MQNERAAYLDAVDEEDLLAADIAREVCSLLQGEPGEPGDEWEREYIRRAEARGLWALQNARREAGTALLEAAGLRPVDNIEKSAALARLCRRQHGKR